MAVGFALSNHGHCVIANCYPATTWPPTAPHHWVIVLIEGVTSVVKRTFFSSQEFNYRYNFIDIYKLRKIMKPELLKYNVNIAVSVF